MKIKKIFKKTEFSWSQVLDSLTSFLLLAGLFIIPLLFHPVASPYSSFDLIKIFALRFLSSLALLTITLRLIFYPFISKKELFWLFKKYLSIPLIFIVALALLVFSSTDSALSFYGSSFRQNGFLSYFYYFLFFILLLINFFRAQKNGELKKLLNKIIFTIVLSSSLVSIYAILQYFGLDIFQWSDPAYLTRRSFSSLGQPNFLASFLVLIAPLPVYLFSTCQKNFGKLFSALSFLLIVFAIFSTASRGGLLAFLFAIFLLVIYKFFFSNLSKKKKVLTVAVFLIFLFLSLFVFEKALPGRVSKMLDFKQGSLASRVEIYSTAFKLIKERPLLGYGQENIQNAFFPYYQADWGVHENIGQVADRAHNIFLDILLSGGFVSLFLHLLFCAFIFSLIWRILKSKEACSGDKNLALAIGIGISAYFFSLLFSFSVPSTEFYFFSLSAIIVALNFKRFQISDNQIFKLTLWQKIILGLFLPFSLFSIYQSANYFLSDYYYNSSLFYVFQGRLPEAIVVFDYSEKTPTNSVFRSEYRHTFAFLASQYYPYKGERATDFMIKEKLILALDTRPYKINEHFRKAKIASALGNYDLAENNLKILINKSPYWPESNLALAENYLQAGKDDDALIYLEKVWPCLPDVSNKLINEEHLKLLRSYRSKTFYYQAQAYKNKSNFVAAADNYNKAYREDPINHMILKEAADMHFMAGDFSAALDLVFQGAKLSSKDFNWPLMAHYIYERQGMIEESKAWLEKAEELGYISEKEKLNN